MNPNKTFFEKTLENLASFIPYFLFLVVAFLFAKYGLAPDVTPPVISGEPQIENPGVVTVISYAEDLAKLETASEKIDFVLKNGKEGIDFIRATPQKQPQVLGSTKAQTNAILWSYINKYRSQFQIPSDKSEGYLVIVPQRMVAGDRDMFFGLWGKTMGQVRREKSVVPVSEKRYAFHMNSVPVHGFAKPFNLFFNTDQYKKIQLGISIGEEYNSTKEIILVFTK